MARGVGVGVRGQWCTMLNQSSTWRSLDGDVGDDSEMQYIQFTVMYVASKCERAITSWAEHTHAHTLHLKHAWDGILPPKNK